MNATIGDDKNRAQYPVHQGPTDHKGQGDMHKGQTHTTSSDDADFADVMRDMKTGEISEAMVHAEGEERTTAFIWILVLCCSVSGLLFGVYISSLLALSQFATLTEGTVRCSETVR